MQIMETLALPVDMKLKPIYMAGDSHSLSPAWKVIRFRGEPRLLRPALVTGLKAWHLRSESKFFPKNNFWNVIKTIPDGSDVIFMFGEIDCREGLLISVEKCRYKDLDEGAEFSVKIYVDIMLKLAEKRGFTIFVHPIIPVLNETRRVVKIFNAILMQHVIKTGGKLRWLDFFDQLLDANGSFNLEYELDGTHLHPKYVPLIEEALKKYE
eukprot:TRINITY_DN673_c0_g1_i1.p1 TRINITY_DN673_c0_g1~~TRINITY_DN673_c0_g1_i1.p1  ORF type:complete len:210 (+),score=50.56 TRINITY_DN673_c0_g1_i1:48-677(+)